MSKTKRILEQKDINKNTLQQRIQQLEEQVKQIMLIITRSTH
jgi:hypothetical protein